MSYGQPPDDDPRLKPLTGWRWRLRLLASGPVVVWRRLWACPCFFVLAGAQVVRRRFGRDE